MAKKFNVSSRTIRYDLDDIEYWLESKNINLVKKTNVGVWIKVTNEQEKLIKDELNNFKLSYNALSKKDRQYYILVEILKSVEPITSKYLAKKLEVSRTTVINDIKNVKEKFKKYNIELKSKPRIGYKIEGNEKNIRQLIGDLILGNIPKDDLLELLSYFNNKEREIYFNNYLKGISKDINIRDIKKVIRNVQNKYNFWITDRHFLTLIIHIAVAIDRLLKGQKIKISQEKNNLIKKENYNELRIATEIGNELSKVFKVKIPEAEILNITIHLLSANLKGNYLHNQKLSKNENNLNEIVDEMLKKVKNDLNINQKNLEHLKEDLLSHLKLTIKQLKLNLNINNPLIEQIKINFSEAFFFAQKMCKVFTQKTNISMPEDEIGYIALHLEAYIEKKIKKHKKKILVVCTTGKGSAKVLATRIENRIPEVVIKDVCSVFELEKNPVLLEDIDLVISTVEIKKITKPVIRVSPLIGDSELNLISNFVHGKKNNKRIEKKGNYITDSLMEIINKYVEPQKKEELRSDIRSLTHFFINNSNNETQKHKIKQHFSENIIIVLRIIKEMLEELELKLNYKLDDTILWGLLTHIIMAIPRWESGHFNKEINVEKYKNKDEFKIINKYLGKISEKLNIDLSDEETIAIMRYFN